MIARFWLVSISFHAALALCAGLIGWRWVREPALAKSTGRWLAALLRDVASFGLALCLLAIWAGLFAPGLPSQLFAVARFLGQGLFGEGVVLAAWVAVVHGRRGRAARGALPAVMATLLALVYFEAYHRCPRDLQVRRHTLDVSGGRSGARVLRILHLSDIQTHVVGAYEERVLREARRVGADLIVWTGDYIQPRLAPTRARASAELAALLGRVGPRAPLGVFAVEGDVDTVGWERMFDGIGATCLANGHASVELPGGGSLLLIGLDAGMSRGNDVVALRRVVEAAPAADVRIVLGHSPDFVQTLAREGTRPRVNLALAGHTHGGQVVLPFVGPLLTLSRLPRRYAGGLHDFEGIALHVSRGIGMERGVAPPVRFLCPPEICVLEVRY